MNSKAEIRTEIRKQYANLSETEWKERSRALYRRIISEPEYQNAKTVFCYVSIKKEPDTWALMQKIIDDGKRLCVPRCKDDGSMVAVVLPQFDLLTRPHKALESQRTFHVPAALIVDALLPLACQFVLKSFAV